MAELTSLEKDVVNVLNSHFERGAHPQEAALALAEMIPSLLGTLAWQPQNVRAAVASAEEVVKHLKP